MLGKLVFYNQLCTSLSHSISSWLHIKTCIQANLIPAVGQSLHVRYSRTLNTDSANLQHIKCQSLRDIQSTVLASTAGQPCELRAVFVNISCSSTQCTGTSLTVLLSALSLSRDAPLKSYLMSHRSHRRDEAVGCGGGRDGDREKEKALIISL